VIVLLPLLAFAFGFVLVAALALMVAPGPAAAIDRRLEEFTAPLRREETEAPRFEAAVAALKRVGDRLPRSPREMGKLRLRLVNAGYRGDEALSVFFGIRAVFGLALFGAMASPLFGVSNVTFAFAGLGFGYLLPGFVLGKMARRRQHRIRLALPDALDLLVVSVEAGLGLDQALQRVGDEMAMPHPDLADEIRLVNLELRAGKGRSEALRNLADRTGVEDLSSLVAMLIQTDKFGTSIAQSLRVFSENLRTRRRQRAEEAAAKTGVKMVFPLVFCIFPGIWVVTIGPAAIRFVQVLFPMAQR
jgi:tight adherence protein C